MATGWSTRELAEMAGTSVKAVRHYHDVGLLDEPERQPNGYKVYEAPHLDRLLHILRLRGIGLPLSRISEVLRTDDADGQVTQQLVEHIDASIRRLSAARAELVAAASSTPEHWKYPRGFAELAPHLSDADRMASLVLARHYSDEAMDSLREMNATPHPVDAELASLPEDATDAAIEDLATRLAPIIARVKADHPMPERVLRMEGPARHQAAASISRALTGIYNEAQLRATHRALELDDPQDPP